MLHSECSGLRAEFDCSPGCFSFSFGQACSQVQLSNTRCLLSFSKSPLYLNPHRWILFLVAKNSGWHRMKATKTLTPGVHTQLCVEKQAGALACPRCPCRGHAGLLTQELSLLVKVREACPCSFPMALEIYSLMRRVLSPCFCCCKLSPHTGSAMESTDPSLTIWIPEAQAEAPAGSISGDGWLSGSEMAPSASVLL